MDDHMHFHGGLTLRSLLENNTDLITIPTRGDYKDKEEEFADPYSDATAAFLGPNLWDKTLSDIKLECLTEFLENNIDSKHQPEANVPDSRQESKHTQMMVMNSNEYQHISYSQKSAEICHETCEQDLQRVPQYPAAHMGQIVLPYDSPMEDAKRESVSPECNFSIKDLALATPPGESHFNPAEAAFQDDDLKPQPILKKSLKNFVPDNMKDDKYWLRRRKNNMAAKRSREARRLKENQIVLRASYLEKENCTLKEDVMRLKAENDMLWRQIRKLKE